jgi:uncharacterized protein YcbX
MPRLARITVYPIKSFDGVAVEAATFTGGGGLANDRRFVFRTRAGQAINGKQFPAVHRLRVHFLDDFSSAEFAFPGGSREMHRLAPDNLPLNARMSDYLGVDVHLEENVDGGFPDDPDSPGPTVLAAATLATVAEWFPPLTLEEVRRRFRANLEFADCPAFWEDRLFAEDASPQTRTVVPFRIGAVTLHGVNPCARCPVPTRDSQTGEPYERFAQLFGRRRQEALPDWAPRTAFDHYYRLSVNTRPAPTTAGGRIAVGDDVDLVATP